MANPNVIFFDVAYMAEGQVDNINRRRSVYQHELPLLNYSCSRNLVQLEDLLITVENNEVILLSKKYGKRMVPRLASAYNYTRSDLSVYRLLCDLQGQQIQNQMTFDLESLIPGLNFYPRVQYGNVVLSPARWKISIADIQKRDLNTHLNFMQVTRYFTAGTADQTLCFDRNSETDLLNFGRFLQQYKEFFITETFIPEQPIVKDEDHKTYCSQFMFILQHNNQLYRPYFPSNVVKKEAAAIIAPGKDWLSFEIYCHPNSVNPILSHEILKFIDRHEREFKCWFFLRYNKPSHHIRLRFQLKEPKDGYSHISALTNALEGYLRAGFIFDIQLKTYKRELSRYRHVEITHIEQLFSADSKYCLNSINNELTSFEMYAVCIRMMYQLIQTLDLGYNTGLTFIKSLQDSLMKEHGLKNNDFKKINQAYLAFADNTKISLNDELLMISRDPLLQSFAETLECCAPEGKMQLFTDLIHMHINRRFPANQRMHEMIIYSFLYKLLQREHKKATFI